MAGKQKGASNAGKKTAIVRMLIEGIVIVACAVVFIVFSRGYINCANRMDFIVRRLEGYRFIRCLSAQYPGE